MTTLHDLHLLITVTDYIEYTLDQDINLSKGTGYQLNGQIYKERTLKRN